MSMGASATPKQDSARRYINEHIRPGHLISADEVMTAMQLLLEVDVEALDASIKTDKNDDFNTANFALFIFFLCFLVGCMTYANTRPQTIEWDDSEIKEDEQC